MKIERVIVLPDLHVPNHDVLSLAAVEQYLSDSQPDEIIYLGDFMDFDCISSHNKENLRAVEGTRIQRDIAEGNVILDRHGKLIPKARRTYLSGNHEYRLNRYVNANPQTEGILDLPNLLNFTKRRIKYVPFWEHGTTHEIGKATFIHGNYFNDAHAKRTVDAYGENIFYGHTHDIQSYSKTTKGNGKTRVGQSLGCLCDYKQRYMRGAPSKWQQAFGVFHFFPDGFFNYFVVSIFKHRFVSPEGKVYDGVELTKDKLYGGKRKAA